MSCSKSSESSSASATTPASTVPATRPAGTRASTPPTAKLDDPDEPLPPLEYEAELPASVREAMYQRYTGDVDELVKRRLVRVGVTYNRTNYFHQIEPN